MQPKRNNALLHSPKNPTLSYEIGKKGVNNMKKIILSDALEPLSFKGLVTPKCMAYAQLYNIVL